jgi:hypothetical protein
VRLSAILAGDTTPCRARGAEGETGELECVDAVSNFSDALFRPFTCALTAVAYAPLTVYRVANGEAARAPLARPHCTFEPSDSENMLRKQARRSFTVEVKHSTTSGRSFIPAKPPQVLQRARIDTIPPGTASSLFEPKAASLETPKVEKTRRILPSLIVWEPSSPEPEPSAVREPSLPRVRRAVMPQLTEDAPRRRGRPRKVVPEVATGAQVEQEVVRAARNLPSAAALTHIRRDARPDATGLPRAERWKRRLPRACW